MRAIHLVLLAGTMIGPTGQAAYAQIGKLPLLDSLSSEGKCISAPINDALKRDGVARLYSFESRSSPRMLSLAVNAREKPFYLMALTSRSLTPTKGEGEHLAAFFSESGRVVRGDRSYTTMGTPASRSEDRRGGLLPEDTVRIERLAKALIARCGG